MKIKRSMLPKNLSDNDKYFLFTSYEVLDENGKDCIPPKLANSDKRIIKFDNILSEFKLVKEGSMVKDTLFPKEFEMVLELMEEIKYKEYDLSKIGDINNYTYQNILFISNIIFTFNSFLIDRLVNYCYKKEVSYYSDKDNEKLKINKKKYESIEDCIMLDKNMIFINSEITKFNEIKGLKVDKSQSNVITYENNIEKIKYFDSIFNYPFVFKRMEKKITREIFEILINNKWKVPKKNLPDSNKYKIKKIVKNINSSYKVIILNDEKDEKINKIIEKYKDNVRLYNIVNNVVFKKGSNLKTTDVTNKKFVLNFNDIINELLKEKFIKLENGFDNLLGFGSISGNKNSISEILSFFRKKDVIPDYIFKELSMYEMLFRHQYAHGWLNYFNVLAAESHECQIDLNEKLDNMLKFSKKSIVSIANFRAELKSRSISTIGKKLYQNNFGASNNIMSVYEPIFNKKIGGEQWTLKIKNISSIEDYVKDRNLFLEKKKKPEISMGLAREGGKGFFYYMSLSNLLMLILEFIYFLNVDED